MSVFCNSKLTYAITADHEDVELLFDFLEHSGPERDEDDEETTLFKDIHLDLQQKYNVTLENINGLNMICGYSKHCSGKSFDIEEINEIDLKRGNDYKNNIIQFLAECGVDHPQQYIPRWKLIAYIDSKKEN